MGRRSRPEKFDPPLGCELGRAPPNTDSPLLSRHGVQLGACLRAIANAKALMATVAMNQPGRLARSARPINPPIAISQNVWPPGVKNDNSRRSRAHSAKTARTIPPAISNIMSTAPQSSRTFFSDTDVAQLKGAEPAIPGQKPARRGQGPSGPEARPPGRHIRMSIFNQPCICGLLHTNRLGLGCPSSNSRTVFRRLHRIGCLLPDVRGLEDYIWLYSLIYKKHVP